MDKIHLSYILEKLRNAIKYSNAVWLNDTNSAVQDLVLLMINEQMKRNEKLSENLNDIVMCEDCVHYGPSGCIVLKRYIQVFLLDGIVVNQWCTDNKFIPDPNFSCGFGRSKKEGMSSALHAHLEAPPIPKKDVQRMVYCKDCLRKGKGGGCPVIAKLLNISVFRACKLHYYYHIITPPDYFYCPYGATKDNENPYISANQQEPEPNPKDMQKDDTLDKLFHKAKALRVSPSPSTIDAYTRINDICDILTIMITYLMAKEKGE